jgi:hypothetical protein
VVVGLQVLQKMNVKGGEEDSLPSLEVGVGVILCQCHSIDSK